MITNHGYINNPTFRGLRWRLSQSFDKIFIIDLHGNSKIKEVSPDGSKDENIFDIMQGVAIILAIRFNESNHSMAEIRHSEIYGLRSHKFQVLSDDNIDWRPVSLNERTYNFLPHDQEILSKYEEGLSLNTMFGLTSIGLQSHRDNLVTDFNKNSLANKLRNVLEHHEPNSLYDKYEFNRSKDWNIETAITSEKTFDENKIATLNYRPFDTRYIYYSDNFIDRSRRKVGENILNHENFILVYPKIVKVNWSHILVTDAMPTAISLDINGTYASPLYLYHEDGTRTPNFNADELKKLTANISLDYVPEDILDYIYGVLHSPSYRETYKEFLKIDFPRVPIPTDDAEFNRVKSFGSELRNLHLMKSPSIDDYVTTFPTSGSNIVEKVQFVPHVRIAPDCDDTSPEYAAALAESEAAPTGDVYINDTQYFGNVPETAWNFYIGGYQPAQKWLKDRRGRTLTNDDLDHYQKIIKILLETDRLMKEIK